MSKPVIECNETTWREQVHLFGTKFGFMFLPGFVFSCGSQGTLPTTDRLRSRMVPVSSLCLVCVADRESSLHLLFECPLAMSYWILTPILIHGRYESIMIWFSHVMSFCSPIDISIAIIVCWTLWTNRNNIVQRNYRSVPRQILNMVGRTLI